MWELFGGCLWFRSTGRLGGLLRWRRTGNSADHGSTMDTTVGEEHLVRVFEHGFVGFFGKLLSSEFAADWRAQLVVPEPEDDPGAVTPGEGF